MTTIAEAKPVANRLGFSAYMQRHRRPLIIFGAMIVFATYVTNDMKRDDLKQLVASLELAKSIYSIRSDNATTLSQFSTLEDGLLDVRNSQVPADDDAQQAEERALIHNLVTSSQFYLNQINVTTDNTRQLLKNLPESKVELTRLQALEQNATTLRVTSNQLYGQADTATGSRLDGLIAKANKLQSDVSNLCVSCCSVAAQAISEAEVVRDERSRNYELWRKISVALYILGWGTTLLTTLCGVGKEGEGII